mgnify:FL=1
MGENRLKDFLRYDRAVRAQELLHGFLPPLCLDEWILNLDVWKFANRFRPLPDRPA